MSSVSVNPPKTPVTKGSNGIAMATIPNVCKMPGPPAPFVPVPLPNIGKSGKAIEGYSQDVTIEGNAVAIKGATFESMGDVASKGTGGGLISANCEGITKFVGPGSMDTKIEGGNVQFLSDPMLNNCGPGGSPPNAATMVGVLQDTGLAAVYGDEACPVCGKIHNDDAKLEETVDSKGNADKLKAAADRAVKKAKDSREERIDQAFQDAKDEARQNYEDAVQRYETRLADQTERAALESLPQEVRDRIQAGIERMKKPTEAVVKREDIAAQIGSGDIDAMLGVVVCREKKVFAGKAGGQLAELSEEMDASWHRGAPSKGKMAKERFTPNINTKALEEEWSRLSVCNTNWEAAVDSAPRTKAGRASAGEPYFPPGQCAAQQCVVLALDHGDRPAGLTERAYESRDTDYQVYAHARDTPGSAPAGRFFGGSNKDKAGDPEAVPPCGTCQVILAMMMCPDIHKKECGPAKTVAECKGCS